MCSAGDFAVAVDLPTEHPDLHLEDGGEGCDGVRFVVLLPERLAPQAACMEMALLLPLLPPTSTPSPLPFLHLWGPEGFVNVCSCQMPALCSPPPSPYVCV